MHVVTISSQRQITLPKAMLESIGAKVGNKLWLKTTDGSIMAEKERDITELAGCFRKYAVRLAPTDEEIDQAVLEYVNKTYVAKTARSR